MNVFAELVQRPEVDRWVFVLLHFLWQGCLIAAVTCLLLRRTRSSNAHRRYLIALLGLGGTVAIPVATWLSLSPPALSARDSPRIQRVAEIASSSLPTNHDATRTTSDSKHSVVKERAIKRWWRNIYTETVRRDEWLEAGRGAAFALWCSVQLLMSFRLFLGSILLWRMRTLARDVSGELESIARRTATRMGLGKIPRVLSSAQISDAAATGLFKSVVLLPASWLTEMPPTMLEAVLAHEFSHIRRYDPWINLVQRIVETVFFYHPAVWWISSQIRIEREHCCDADAIKVIGCPMTFAKTLERAARYRESFQFSFSLCLGDNRMLLLNRVNRILNKTELATHARWQNGLVAAFVPIMLLVAAALKNESTAQLPTAPKTLPSSVSQSPAKPHLVGLNVPADATPQVESTPPPSELSKISLPDYVIEPPDVLQIDGIRLVRRKTYQLCTNDVLHIVVQGTKPERPISGQFLVQDGKVQLGPGYGNVHVLGKTTDQAKQAIREKLESQLGSPEVMLSLIQVSGEQFITGEHLVAQDGTINLGIHGRVYVAGMTLEAAKESIEEHLSTYFETPEVAVDVFAYNSKFFFIISETKDGNLGDQVVRIPITGNETVLDAVALIGGIGQSSEKRIWISRPSPNGLSTDVALAVDWEAITRGANTSTNYQLLPGDRLFISDQPPANLRHVSIESKAKQVRELVQDNQYQEALRLIRDLTEKDANSPIGKSMVSQIATLEQQLAADLVADMEETAALIAQLREQRLEELRIRKLLRSKMKANFDDVSLSSAVDVIAQQLGINIVLDPEGLACEGVTKDTRIDLQLRQEISASNLLNLALEPHRLVYTIDNGVLKITSAYSAQADVTSRTYDVSDLLSVYKTQEQSESTPEQSAIDSLRELIRATVSPDHWDKVGGPGTVQAFGNDRLVISCSRDVHSEIEGLISELRAIAEPHPSVLQRFPDGFEPISSR